jgi:hypothetical protein
MNMVDDATGASMALMAEEETTEAAVRLLKRWIERYGIARALCADKKNVFVTDREPPRTRDFHRRGPKGLKLAEVFSWEETRTLISLRVINIRTPTAATTSLRKKPRQTRHSSNVQKLLGTTPHPGRGQQEDISKES